MAMSDEEVIAELHAAVKDERRSTRRVLIALRSFDERGLGRGRGQGTTFDYCTRVLGYSASAAYKRIHAARLSADHPDLLDKIESGSLSLSSIGAVYSLARKEGGAEVLAAVEGKTCREVEVFVAQHSPIAAPRDLIQPIAVTVREPEAAPVVQPAYRLHLTLSEEAHAKLRRAVDLLRHRIPGGEPHAVVEAALDALLDDVDRDRKRPSRVTEVAPGGRRIPEWVKDAVWARDGGRCAWTDGDARCGSTAWLQYDHVTPFARGGVSDDPLNVRLLCGAHNRHAARAAGLTGPSRESTVDG